MRRSVVVAVMVLTACLSGVTAAQQGDLASTCSLLERPNIDCDCVAKRIALFDELSPDTGARAVIQQGYRYALGQQNTYMAALESSMRNPMSAMAMIQAYDPLGGRPENITEYEEGCVIAGAEPAEIKVFEASPAVEQFIAGCTGSTSDPRYCACAAQRKSTHLSHAEFEAYYRSFSDYSDDDARSLAEMSAMRGEAMQLSAEEFDDLQRSARIKLAQFLEADENYCYALLWADQNPGKTAVERQQAGF